MQTNRTSLMVLAVILLTASTCALAIRKGPSDIDFMGKVTKVIDGDTLKIRVIKFFGYEKFERATKKLYD